MTEAEAKPDYVEIDLASEQARALLRSAAERHGETVVRAAGMASRLFLLRSPWAPGLWFVGGQATPASHDPQRSSHGTLNLSGTGETLEDALVSCIGEGIERLAQFEHPGDICARATLPEVRDRVMPGLTPIVEQELTNRSGSVALEWISGRLLKGNAETREDPAVLLPADWVLRRVQGGQVRLPPITTLSTGAAAGPNWDWAASRAILELVERDAASLWWIGGCRGRSAALDDPSLPGIVRLLGTLRGDARARRTWLLDITTDIGIPVVAALSCSSNGRGLACGLAARTSLAAAARAALLELCQMELAIIIARAKLVEKGEAGLAIIDRQNLERATRIDVGACELLHPLGCPVSYCEDADRTELSTIADRLAHAGIEAALVDLTRPQSAIRVVRAIAPALQPMPSDMVTPRLQRALTETGGGTRHTNGVALM